MRCRIPEPAPEVEGRTPPVGPIETWIASLFCELLGREEVGADESFFELGGHSLLAVRLLSRINARAKEPLDVGAIFARPTVRELARAVATGGAAKVPSLVALNRADPTSMPLFCICGVQLYARLAKAMEADRRVYGAFLPIEAEALARPGAPPRLDVASMAAAYVDLIQEQRPSGPYLLGGVSFGGILAFEMAQQLRARGETVALLVLFDAILPRALRPLSATERARVQLRRLAEDPRALVDHYSDRVRRHLVRWTRLRGAKTTRDDVASIDLVRDELFRRASHDYDAMVRPYDGKVVLFQSRDGLGSETERVEWDRGWTGLVPPGTAMHAVPGTHLRILEEPGVFEIAHILRTHLRDIDERPPVRRIRRASSTRLLAAVGRPTSTDI